MEWLGNFYIIFFYNIVFGVATALSLTTKFTAAVRREIYNRLESLFHRDFPTSMRDRDSRHSMSYNTSNTSIAANGNGVHVKED